MECLCYTEEKGLFVDYTTGDKLPEGCLFREHDSLKSRINTIEVPNNEFKITIESKLGNYSVRSWHYACLEYKGKCILNFDADTFKILNQKVDYFSVIPGHWNELFQKITNAWLYRDADQTPSASTYLRKINSLLDYNSVYVKSTIQHPSRPTLWHEPFILLLHASNILADYVKKLPKSTAYEMHIINKTVEVCSLFLSTLKKDFHTFNMNADDSRVETLGKNTATIINFMSEHQAGVNFLQISFGELL